MVVVKIDGIELTLWWWWWYRVVLSTSDCAGGNNGVYNGRCSSGYVGSG